MTGHYGIETTAYHDGFRITCRIPSASHGWTYGELTVEDRKAGVRLTLPRHEWSPLLKAIRQALRSASEALEVVPADPVVRAAARIPVRSHAMALARGAVLTKYERDLKVLRESYVEQAESLAARFVTLGLAPPP